MGVWIISSPQKSSSDLLISLSQNASTVIPLSRQALAIASDSCTAATIIMGSPAFLKDSIQLYLKPYPSVESIVVNCIQHPKNSTTRNNLSVSINPEEYAYYLINDAYK